MVSATAVFDIIGTCFSLEKVREALVKAGAPPFALEMWFAQSLRDSFGFSHAGGYLPLKDVLRADLPRTLAQLGLTPADEGLGTVLESMGALEARPDLSETLRLLKDSGWRTVALTMGAVDSTRRLLTNAGVVDHFDRLRSCDEISVTKPNPAVYRLALDESDGAAWMVAAHAWDIAGAARAGLQTAFVTMVEKSYPDVYPKPDVIAGSLLEAAHQMVER